MVQTIACCAILAMTLGPMPGYPGLFTGMPVVVFGFAMFDSSESQTSMCFTPGLYRPSDKKGLTCLPASKSTRPSGSGYPNIGNSVLIIQDIFTLVNAS